MRLAQRAGTLLCVAFNLSLGLVAATVVLPTPRAKAFWAVHLVTSELSLWLVIPAVVGLILTFLRPTGPRGWIRHACRATAAVAAMAALVPLLLAWPTARATDTQLSLRDYLFGGFNYSPTPDAARTVAYEVVDGDSLPLEAWKPATSSARPAPAVIWLHGGGFVSGREGRLPDWDRWLAQQGYAAFDVQYRLSPPARWNEAVGDVKCAIGWIRSHATQLGVDPNRMVAVGESAGGTLALEAAYTPHSALLPASCPASDATLSAVVGFYPLTDLTQGWKENVLAGDGRKWLQEYTDATPSSNGERYRLASPVDQVSGSSPPTLLLQGGHDTMLSPRSQADALAARLKALAVPYRVVTIPGADHGFDFQWGGWATQISRNVLGQFLRRYAPIS